MPPAGHSMLGNFVTLAKLPSNTKYFEGKTEKLCFPNKLCLFEYFPQTKAWGTAPNEVFWVKNMFFTIKNFKHFVLGTESFKKNQDFYEIVEIKPPKIYFANLSDIFKLTLINLINR